MLKCRQNSRQACYALLLVSGPACVYTVGGSRYRQSLLQDYSSSGTMLPMLTGATYPLKPYSHKQVRWTCDQCADGHQHSWLARVSDRTRGSGCPQCCGRQVCKHNSLATKAPLIAAQWDYDANDGTPDDVVAQSHQLATWHCNLCGCKWEAAISTRVSKSKAGSHSAVMMQGPRREQSTQPLQSAVTPS